MTGVQAGGEKNDYNWYPLVICYIAIENGHLWWVVPLKRVIFHSYVGLPEGNYGNKLTI